MADIEKMKVAELKEKLEALGESTKGTKAELVERLKGVGALAKPAGPTIAEQHAFLDVAKAFDFVKVRALVSDNIEYVNAQPSGRWTAIHQAALHGDRDTIEFLIDKGADLKCKTRDGQMPHDVAKDAACKAMLQPPSGKSKAAPTGVSAPAPKSQKVSMKGDVVQKIASVKTGSDVKMVVKGRAAVDTGFKNASEFHVYESGGDIYDATLNQADIKNNHNKYYIIQLLETDKKPPEYYTWNRWGRVGEAHSQSAERGPMSLHEAMEDFKKKFHDKTKNAWEQRDSFVPKSGKYTLIHKDYDVTEPPAAAAPAADGSSGAAKPVESKLDMRVQSFVSLIADVKMMEQQMVEIGFDAKKMPLGKLKKETIMQAYSVLQSLAKIITPDALASGAAGSSSGGGISAAGKQAHTDELMELSSQFYTLIPHSTKGLKDKLPTIDSPQMLKAKTELVEALGEIQLASKVIDTGAPAFDLHPIDARYAQLKTDMRPIDVGTAEHVLLATYLTNTHAATHSQYKLELVQAFEVAREGEAAAFTDVGNRQLLWHGSRLTNWCGILSQGLRIAPPEAPVTGYMFGKGVYFADMSSKSANYCFANKQSSTAVLLLCDVALGGAYERSGAEFGAAESCKAAAKQHTWGKGRTAPDSAGMTTLPGDATLKVPMGQGQSSGVQATSLLYNEFIVYDTKQIKQKYILQVKFNFLH